MKPCPHLRRLSPHLHRLQYIAPANGKYAGGGMPKENRWMALLFSEINHAHAESDIKGM